MSRLGSLVADCLSDAAVCCWLPEPWSLEVSGLELDACVACLRKYSSRGGEPVVPAPLHGFLKAVVRMSIKVKAQPALRAVDSVALLPKHMSAVSFM